MSHTGSKTSLHITPPKDRYAGVLILLHWVMAFGVIGLLVSGTVMTGEFLEPQDRYKLFQTHKAFGVLMLLALGVRIGVRIASTAPKLPFAQPIWESLAGKAGHIALYVLMFVMVMSGWLMVSASPLGLPTSVFGWFYWPHMPGISANEALSKTAKTVHDLSSTALILVIVLHLAAIVKHRLFEQVNILPRMWWANGAFMWVSATILGAGALATTLNMLGANSVATNADVTSPQTHIQSERSAGLSMGTEFEVDYTRSAITFSGEHAGTPFEGRFNDWTANIVFDPDALDKSRFTAEIPLESARTGDDIYDGTLPETDWFDIETYPTATFKTSTISETGSNTYAVYGVLDLKGKQVPVQFEMQLTNFDQEIVTATAIFSLDRLLFGIGANADPDAEWVTQNIGIAITIVASRK